MNDMNDLNDLNDRIARHLGSQSTNLALRTTPVGDVVRRGRQRRNNRRTAAGAFTAIAVSAGTIAGISALSQPEHRRVTNGPSQPGEPTSPTPATTIASAPDGSSTPLANRVDSNLVWTTVVPDSAEALASAAFGDSQSEPPFIAVSSAPGQTKDEWKATMYRSDDGISWTPTNAKPGGPLTAYDAYGGAMYAFSTAAATAPIAPGGAGDVVIESSSDGGDSWNTQILPLDMRTIADSPGVASVVFDWRNVVAGPVGTLAVGKVSVQIDYAELDAPFDQNAVKNITADGIEIYSNPCTTPTTVAWPTGGTAPVGQCDATGDTIDLGSEFFSWADLGLDQSVIDAINAPPYAFVKLAGATEFTAATFPVTPEGYRFSSVMPVATDDGFAIAGTLFDQAAQSSLTKVYRTADSVTWSEADLPLSYVQSFGQLDDGSWLALGSANDAGGGAAAATSIDGVTWSVVDLASMLTADDGVSATLYSGTSTIGSSGATLSAFVQTDPFVENGPATVTVEGITITQTSNNPDFVFTDAATGVELGRWSVEDGKPVQVNTRIDRQVGYLELLNEDGSVKLALSDAIVNDLNSQVEQGLSSAILLHSDNGVDWSREDLGTLAGFDVFSPTRIQSSGNTVLVTVVDSSAASETTPARTVVLVGTPKQ